MKKFILLIAILLPSVLAVAQPFCSVAKIKVDNITVVNTTEIEMDILVGTALNPADPNGTIYLGPTDAVIGFDSSKFTNPTVELMGDFYYQEYHCTFVPTNVSFAAQVQANTWSSTAVELLPNLANAEAIVVNYDAPGPLSQPAFNTQIAVLADQSGYTNGQWCKIKITGYTGNGTDHGLAIINPQTGTCMMPPGAQEGDGNLDVPNMTKVFTLANTDPWAGSATNIDNTLPVRLIDFAANKYNRSSSMLVWQTVTEQNASHFMIERSERGTEAWETVGKVDAAGNSTNVETYEFIDRGAYNGLRARVEFLYRLKIVDNDDSFEYSNIEAVTFTSDGSGSGEVTVFPNPVKDVLHVQIAGNMVERPSDIVIYDVLGKLVYSKQISDDADYTYINMYEAGIEAGTYLVQFVNNDVMISQEQVIVQR